eukprot:31075-Pelagococcus_subviridis.AAC.8
MVRTRSRGDIRECADVHGTRVRARGRPRWRRRRDRDRVHRDREPTGDRRRVGRAHAGVPAQRDRLARHAHARHLRRVDSRGEGRRRGHGGGSVPRIVRAPHQHVLQRREDALVRAHARQSSFQQMP